MEPQFQPNQQQSQQGLPNVQYTTMNVQAGPANIQPTGIAGLDIILKGGIPRGSNVLLAGAAGTGKTTLCNQWLFAGYQQFSEPGLFLCMTESPNRAIKNMANAPYFNEQFVGQGKVQYADLRGVLENIQKDRESLGKEHIEQVVDAIGNMVIESGAKRVVIDSITALAYRFVDKSIIRQFIFHLGSTLAYLDATVILTSEVDGEKHSVFQVEEFICDGIIRLHYNDESGAGTHQLLIRKMRDKDYEAKPVSYRLSGEGIKIFPPPDRSINYPVSNERLQTGVPGLDEMMDGGYLKGSCVFLSGAAGTGKSLVSLQFVNEGLEKKQPCLYVSLEESRAQIYRNAQSFGWNLEKYEAEGLLHTMVTTGEQVHLDELYDHIKQMVEQGRFERVVLDSLSALENIYPMEQVRSFAAHLMTLLKSHGITMIYTHASENLFGTKKISDSGVSTIADQILMLRYVEIDSKIHHAILILKMRGTHHDKRLRQLTFTKSGLNVTTDFSGYEGVMSGVTRKVSSSTEEEIHTLFLETLGPMGEKYFKQQRAKGLNEDGISIMIDELKEQGIISSQNSESFSGKLNDILSSST